MQTTTYTVTGDIDSLNYPTQLSTSTENDNIFELFGYLFSHTDSLIEKNKFLILYLQDLIVNNNLDWVKAIISDSAFEDLHPSLLKSALIITDNIGQIKEAHDAAQNTYKGILEKN